MATKSIAWNTGSGNITLTYQGQGDGTIAVSSDANDIGSARSQTITVQTVGGAITQNLTVSQAACPFPVGDVKSYSYTGSYQEVELPAGQYKFQCWGAQGGSNAAYSSYSITAKAGGKGGYSEGIITLSQKTTVRVYVGGQGSSSAGGYNGGGSTTGTSSYNASSEFGYSKMGGGGGATDIRLSDGALLSRMIVAGGGSGGAMCYRSKTTSTTTWTTVSSGSLSPRRTPAEGTIVMYLAWISALSAGTYRISFSQATDEDKGVQGYDGDTYKWSYSTRNSGSYTFTVTSSNASSITRCNVFNELAYSSSKTCTYTLEKQTSSSSTSTSNDSQIGGVGGGTNGGGYSSTYYATQSAAGSGGSFGQGANQTTTGYRYCSGAGGGGWYGGGGGKYSDSSMSYCKYSGGGSGFVNTAASAGNRPSGYTGLELDSGTTYAGDTSFPSTSGSTETGHSGNGYAKITRLDPNIMEFEYSGAVESKTLAAGTYKIECWGAQGGYSYSSSYPGGKGGYSVGELTLVEQTTFYIYVGGKGTDGTTSGTRSGGFNGGGSAYASTSYYNAAGGGASDVRIGSTSLYARVIVAGGGGGAGSYSSSYRYAGGAGGGTSGVTPAQYSTSYRAGTGGTQTTYGTSYYGSTANSTTYGYIAAFGQGGYYKSTSYYITGGGGGWYGGGYARMAAGGGGSGYVYTESTASDYPSGCLLNSSYYLANAQIIAGDTSMPSVSGSTETGHEGNGFVRITKI